MWLRTLIVLAVLGGCGVYTTVSFIHGQFPPMFVMVLPTITYILVHNRFSVIKFGKGGMTIEKDKDDDDGKG